MRLPPYNSLVFSLSAPSDDAWSVSELTRYIRELFEIDFRLQDVTVSGEISNFTRARSGHLYFTLKDSGAQLKCVMWRSAAERLRFNLQDGDAVVAQGRVSVYEVGGAYQLYAERVWNAGIFPRRPARSAPIRLPRYSLDILLVILLAAGGGLTYHAYFQMAAAAVLD